MYTYSYRKTGKKDWLDISYLVNSAKTSIVNGICSRDFKSTTNTASFEILPVNAYIGIYRQFLEDIIIAQGDMNQQLEARILRDGVVIASGYVDLASVVIQSSMVPDNIKVTIRDYITDLDKKCKANLVREGISTVLIVEELLELAGVNAKLISEDKGVVVNHFVITEDDDNSFREIIDTLLFEMGNKVLYRNPTDANYYIKPIICKDEPSKVVSYLVNKTLKTTSKIWDYDGIKVKYPTVSTSTNMSMYIDAVSTKLEGEPVNAKAFYPKDGDVNAVFQEYRKEILDHDYNSKITRRQNADIDLLYVKDAALTLDPSGSFTTPTIPDVGLDVNPKFYPRKAQCLIMNNSDEPTILKQFDVIGTAVYRSNINSYTLPEKAFQPLEYDSSYIESEEDVKAFATAYLNLSKYGSTLATWATTVSAEEYPLGSSVIVRHKADSQLSQGFTVISIEITSDKGIPIRKYVAVANSKYNEYQGVLNTSKPSSSANKGIVKDVQQFYLSTDPETPTEGKWDEDVPTITATSKYLFARRFVRYVDGSEYISPYYRIGVGEDGKPAMALQLSGLTYHYDAVGALVPAEQMITASVTGIPDHSPIHWSINGKILDTQETKIEVPPTYMQGRNFIEIKVELETMSLSNTIVRVMDGADYVPVVQYRYSTSRDDPNADSHLIAYGAYTVVYGAFSLCYGDEDWTVTVPVGEKYKNMYLWKRSWSYKLGTWIYERVSDVAILFEIYPSSYTYPISPRNIVDTEVGFTYRVQGVSGVINWSSDVGKFEGSLLVLPASIVAKNVTVTATYGELKRTITLSGIESDNMPLYGGITDTPPSGRIPIDGDYYMTTGGIPMRYNAELKQWVALTPNDINQSDIMDTCGKDWIAHGNNVTKVQSAIYAYYQQLYAQDVTAESINTDKLYSREIKVGDRLVSGGYTEVSPDGVVNPHKKAGFYADSEGKVMMEDAFVSGNIDSQVLSTYDAIDKIDSSDLKPEYREYWDHATTDINVDYQEWEVSGKVRFPESSPAFSEVATDGKIIVGVGLDNQMHNKAMFSPDGRIWKEVPFPQRLSDPPKGEVKVRGIVYSPEYKIFVAVDEANYSYVTSDGQHWEGPFDTGYGEPKGDNYVRGVRGIAYVNKTFIITGSVMKEVSSGRYRSRYMTSTDGKTWTEHLFPRDYPFYCNYIRTCGDRAVIQLRDPHFESNAPFDEAMIASSADGTDWVFSHDPVRKVAYYSGTYHAEYFKGKYFIFGIDDVGEAHVPTGWCVSSSDGVTWEEVPFFSRPQICPMAGCAAEGIFWINNLHTTDETDTMFYTKDGINWHTCQKDYISMNFLVYANNMFIGMRGHQLRYASKYLCDNMRDFFRNIENKISNSKLKLEYEPLRILVDCTGTIIDNKGRVRELANISFWLHEIHFTFVDGEKLVVGRDDPLSWPLVIDNLIIRNIPPMGLLGNILPKQNEQINIGAPDNQFNEIYAKEFYGHLTGGGYGNFSGVFKGQGYGQWVGNVNPGGENQDKYKVWGAVAN